MGPLCSPSGYLGLLQKLCLGGNCDQSAKGGLNFMSVDSNKVGVEGSPISTGGTSLYQTGILIRQ